MAHHLLSLEIPDILNECIFRVYDTSIYEPLIPKDCPTLEITPPGFVNPAVITTLAPNFTANITACDMGIQTANCSNYHNNLSDGVYIVRWSIAPNDKVFVEYNHLRISHALNKYNEALCCIQRSFGCDPSPEILKKIQQAQLIRTYLDAAKAEVEYCHHPKDGMTTYRYAMDLLQKLLCGCGCGEGCN
jgi:hypothetical protein